MVEERTESNAAPDVAVSPKQGVEAAEANGDPSRPVVLKSLAPEYLDGEHALYVDHLLRAVADKTVLNIALTGRYGSGKSSILDHFYDRARQKKLDIQRISINTLGPDEEEDITNRIQKELVKQLVYRAAPGAIRRSRFARSAVLTRWQLTRNSAFFAAVAAGLLWLTGVRPSLGQGGGAWFLQAGAFLLFILLLALVLGVASEFLSARRVSQVTAVGTTIHLEDKPESYFDKYLDELVVYFEATDPDIVIFEDLDRFDDPRIFDSLRELNTLINSSSHWASRSKGLRFIYAIKDSLFEQLGKESSESDEKEQGGEEGAKNSSSEKEAAHTALPEKARKRDTAAEAVERANRTKFFEVVIPIVPFLSHSNARDHLIGLLEEVQMGRGDQIDRRLIDIVARHSTDMRLMINIRNEYVVFAERLLWGNRGAPGLDANALFALVAYKNFHLADFEALPHRGSVLDLLEAERRKFVREAIERLESERRELHRVNAVQREQALTAKKLGERLSVFAASVGGEARHLQVGDQTFDFSDAEEVATWKHIVDAGSLVIHAGLPYTPRIQEISNDLLKALFFEGADPEVWLPADQETLLEERSAIDQKIASIRGNSYAGLARYVDSKSNPGGFEAVIKSTLTSELARELVLQGFIDRYYAEYATVFYGSFLGVEVANYFRNAVWPNEMDLDTVFKKAAEVANVLEQAPEGFTGSRSVLNPSIVRYLVRYRPELASEVVGYLVTHESKVTFAFLKSFFGSGTQAERPVAETDKEGVPTAENELVKGERGDAAADTPEEGSVLAAKTQFVALLAAHPWAGLFNYLAAVDSMPDEATQTALLDAALRGVVDADAFELNDQAAELIRCRHEELSAFISEPQSPDDDNIATVFALSRRARLVAPALRPLSSAMRNYFVQDWRYDLTADNLRSALGLDREAPILLEEIYRDAAVSGFCRENIDDYLAAVENDPHTKWIAMTPDGLIQALVDRHVTWSDDQKKRILGLGSPDAALPDIGKIPTETWPVLAAADRMVPSLDNLAKYAVQYGVDQSLASVLVPSNGEPISVVHLTAVEKIVAQNFALQVLDASDTLTLDARVAIARQVHDELKLGDVEVTALKQPEDGLLAMLLRANMVSDSAATFKHFLAMGWASVSAAFEASTRIYNFLKPDLIAGHELDLLQDSQVPDRVKQKVLRDFDSYLASLTDTSLTAVLPIARRLQVPIPLAHLETAAPHVGTPDDVLWHIAKLVASGQSASGGRTVLRVLAALGGEYSGFGGGPGQEIDLQRTDSTAAIIEYLKRAELVTTLRGTNKQCLKLRLS